MTVLVTPRLTLEPITLSIVEAAFVEDRVSIERITKAKLPEQWPGRALIERAFCASIENIRSDPETRLWGDRLIMIRPESHPGPSCEREVIGSVVFHGRPKDGIAEIGYGIEERWRGAGYAAEATQASVEWALRQPGITCVVATTPPWHAASIRVLERAGLLREGVETHGALGEVLRFVRRSSP
jgi:ribosomal-protein-alanine N-acetyltransferase